jgi:hypothetical protein
MSESPETAVTARFASKAMSFPIRSARNVRADITFEDAEGMRVAAHPAPWLYRAIPIVSFDVGDTNELVVAIVSTDIPRVDHVRPDETPITREVFTIVEDGADRNPVPARYTYSRGLVPPVKVILNLTVNGMAMPPYRFRLEAGDRTVRPPKSPSLRLIAKKVGLKKSLLRSVDSQEKRKAEPGDVPKVVEN